jgi:hypothetical protein
MLRKLLLLVALFASTSAYASSCLTPAQVRSGYNGCMRYLKLTPAKQRKVADATPYTLQQVNWACQLQKRKGLKAMLANERVYCRAMNSGGYERSGRSTPYEEKKPVCSMQSDCRGGYCGAANVCTNGGNGAACDSSSQCANGYCSLGGTCN